MEPDVALSVKQLYELLVMPEWQQDQVGDTRGYAFLMLAEGAIHGILFITWSGTSFDGTMTYPDGDTVTTVSGTAEPVDGSVQLTWKELAFVREGRRPVDFNVSYAATVSGNTMDGAWYQANRRVARFTMTASDRSTTRPLVGRS
jgi:hypothetical protein